MGTHALLRGSLCPHCPCSSEAREGQHQGCIPPTASANPKPTTPTPQPINSAVGGLTNACLSISSPSNAPLFWQSKAHPGTTKDGHLPPEVLPNQLRRPTKGNFCKPCTRFFLPEYQNGMGVPFCPGCSKAHGAPTRNKAHVPSLQPPPLPTPPTARPSCEKNSVLVSSPNVTYTAKPLPKF